MEMLQQTFRLEDLRVKTYQDIAWLAGLVFLDRHFVALVDEHGLETLAAECPYGDLATDEWATFTAAFNHPKLRQVVTLWWQEYDAAREAGEIPQPQEPWSPYMMSIAQYQDITWLAGAVFLRRDFVQAADAQGLESLLAECPYGDLTSDEWATYTAAFNHPKLRQTVALWWQEYDIAREAGEIPQAGQPWLA